MQAEALARDRNYWMTLALKEALRWHDERRKPLMQYREEELARMRENFYGSDPSYREARRRFVHKLVGQTSPLPQAARGLTPGARAPRELRAS